MDIIIKNKMKKLIFKLGSALLLSVVVCSCAHEDEDFENNKAELKLVNEKFSMKNDASHERQKQAYITREQSDSITLGRSEQTAEKDLIETVDPDKIKPPQH